MESNKENISFGNLSLKNCSNASAMGRSFSKNGSKSFNLSFGNDSSSYEEMTILSSKNLSMDSGKSRWSSVSTENLHKDPQRCLKTHIAQLKKPKPHQASSKNMAIRKILRCSAKDPEHNKKAEYERQLLQLLETTTLWNSSLNKDMKALCESVETFLMEREETSKLLDIYFLDSKTFDPKLVHDSLVLFNFLIETLCKEESRLEEINSLISTREGCEVFGVHETSLFSEAIKYLRKTILMSPCKNEHEVEKFRAAADAKRIVDDFSSRLWVFNILTLLKRFTLFI